MDEYNINMLHSSKDEYCCRLLNILTPLMIEGIKSIFREALDLCKKNNEPSKYLMTFQNFITRVPKWNSEIIEIERKRIIDKSGCIYLEDLITCIHIIQLKLLTSMRVGQKQKKIDISILKLDEFIHKCYINVARKVYKNVYLFEINIESLQIQKNNRELEIIIKECILNTIRDSIPIETILKAYMDETVEDEYIEESKEELVNEKFDKETIEKIVKPNSETPNPPSKIEENIVDTSFPEPLLFSEPTIVTETKNITTEIIADLDADADADNASQISSVSSTTSVSSDDVKLNIEDMPEDQPDIKFDFEEL